MALRAAKKGKKNKKGLKKGKKGSKKCGNKKKGNKALESPSKRRRSILRRSKSSLEPEDDVSKKNRASEPGAVSKPSRASKPGGVSEPPAPEVDESTEPKPSEPRPRDVPRRLSHRPM